MLIDKTASFTFANSTYRFHLYSDMNKFATGICQI